MSLVSKKQHTIAYTGSDKEGSKTKCILIRNIVFMNNKGL